MSPSPLSLDPALFDPAAVPEDTKAFYKGVLDTAAKVPKIWDVGIDEYRRLRASGQTPWPIPQPLPSAAQLAMPTRDAGRTLPCHVLRPQGDGKPATAVFLHLHGGGWALGSEIAADEQLQRLADEHGLVCVSVGYRLTPEHPFPAGIDDACDAAEWLAANAEAELGAPLGFVGGESAGAHLSALAALHLLKHPEPRFSGVRLRGLVLHYGCYTLIPTPSVALMERHTPEGLTLLKRHTDVFVDMAMPGASREAKLDPKVSPLYADLEALRGRLPPALFTVGTKDCLLDDTLFMSARWAAAGGETLLEVVPGGHHGYSLMPTSIKGSGAAQGQAAVDKFIAERL
jgi:acetyl esterase/lipase